MTKERYCMTMNEIAKEAAKAKYIVNKLNEEYFYANASGRTEANELTEFDRAILNEHGEAAMCVGVLESLLTRLCAMIPGDSERAWEEGNERAASV